MYFAFKWKHRGSTIEFTSEGWHADDPRKTEWLQTESGLSKAWPLVPVTIRLWLQHHCELMEFRGVVPD